VGGGWRGIRKGGRGGEVGGKGARKMRGARGKGEMDVWKKEKREGDVEK